MVSFTSRLLLRTIPAILLLGLATGPTAAGPEPDSSGEVFQVRVSSIIHPISRDLLVDALELADREGATLVVLELDTPGGLLTSTREMTTAMLGARTPVVVWVAPEGAQAASAGFFLLMAGDFAAMAPSTNTGAAHPVGGQGETIEGHLGEKIEQDSAATIRTLAERRGRNLELAEQAVVQSRSFTASEALESGLVDLIAPDLPSLLEGLEGREFEKPAGEKRILQLKGASVRVLEMNPVQRFLATLLHPNVVYILLSLGMIGLYVEITHPGAIFPGIVGGIFVLLSLYGLSVLPVRFAGVALIVLGLGLLIAEIKVTSYGLLTVGGVGSLVLGSLILFRSAEPALRVSINIIVTVAIFFLLVAGFLVTMAIRAMRGKVRTGTEQLLGSLAVARTRLDPSGKVFLLGEWWNAISDSAVEAGDQVEVVAVEGMTLRVRPSTAERSS